MSKSKLTVVGNEPVEPQVSLEQRIEKISTKGHIRSKQ